MPRRGAIRESMIREASAESFAEQIAAWMRAYFAAEAQRALERAPKPGPGQVEKASANERMADRLRAIISRHGGATAARAASSTVGARVGTDEVTRQREWLEWRDRVTDSILGQAERTLLDAASTEIASGTSRRLLDRVRARAGELALDSRAGLLAARNITATAAQLGQEAGYEATGVEVIEWQAFQSPIWPRRHDKLDGEMRRRGDPFTMPVSKRKLRWPHDPQGHVSEVINCRCTAAPVIRGTRAWDEWLKTAEGRKDAKREREEPSRPTPEIRSGPRPLTAAERALGITEETRRPLRSARRMRAAEISAEFDRISRLSPAEFERVVFGQDRPARNQTVMGVPQVLSAFIAGNTHGMLRQHPKVFRAITKRPLERTRPLYRGMSGLDDATLAQLRPGATFNVRAGASFSGQRSTAENFAQRRETGRVVFRLQAPTRGADVSGFSQIQTEDEVILGGTYRIRSVSEADGYTLVDLEEQ